MVDEIVRALEQHDDGATAEQPDPLRLRNREQLTEVVSTIVRDDAPIEDARIRAITAPIVAPEDLEDFIAMAISELSGLHEGNLVRYRLRLSEFRRWRGRLHSGSS